MQNSDIFENDFRGCRVSFCQGGFENVLATLMGRTWGNWDGFRGVFWGIMENGKSHKMAKNAIKTMIYAIFGENKKGGALLWHRNR